MMRVVLGHCIESSPYMIETVHEEFRLGQVHALLSQWGIEARIDDHLIENLADLNAVRAHAQEVASWGAEIFVFFIRQRSPGLNFTLRWVRQLRSVIGATSKAMICLAGDTSVGIDDLLYRKQIDLVFEGNEDSVARGTQHLVAGGALSVTPGARFLSDDGTLKRNHDSAPPIPLDSLPHPTLYVADRIYGKDNPGKRYLPYIRATRGCYAACAFCHESVRSPIRRTSPHERVSVQWLSDEMARLRSLGVAEVVFQDSNFLPHPRHGGSWVIDFARMMREENPEMRYGFWTRAQDLTPSRMSALASTSLAYVLIGAESLDDTRLHRLRKAQTAADIWAAMSLLSQHNIEGKISFILFEPDTTLDQLQLELREIHRLFTAFPNVQRNPLFVWNLLFPHPGSPQHADFERKGWLVKDPQYPFEEHFTHMAARSMGLPTLVPVVQDTVVAILCEAFRVLQYEYSLKWFRVREHSETNSPFFTNMPIRLLKILSTLVEQAREQATVGISTPKQLQSDLTDSLYFGVLSDYEAYLPTKLRELETPSTIRYAARWRNILPIGSTLE